MRKWTIRSIATIAFFASAAAFAQGTKWHPGHYVMLNGNDSIWQHLRTIEEIGDEPSIKGVMVRIWWKDLEPGWNDYDFSRIRTYLRKLGQQPTTKRLVVRVMDRRFHSDEAWNIVPNYLRNDPTYDGGIVRARTGYVARLWNPQVMWRLIKLYKAIGWVFDDHWLFEGVFTEESTLSLKRWDLPYGYSDKKLADQYVRFMKNVKPSYPTSHVFMNLNWLGGPRMMDRLFRTLVSERVALGGSNTWVEDETLAQRVLMGHYGADYRWQLAIGHGVESSEFGGGLGDSKPWEVVGYSYWKLRGHYLFWTRNTWTGDSDQRWYTGILPYLRNWPKTRGGCPNTYGWCTN